MVFLVLYVFALSVAVLVGLMSANSDLKTMTIPNQYVLVVLASAVVAFLAGHFGGLDAYASYKSYMLSGVVMFCVTYLLFVFKIFGGGDAKLLTAYAFWFKFGMMVDLVFYCTLIGAVMGGVSMVIKKKKPFKVAAEKSWIGRVQAGDGVVAYGVPIVISAMIVLFGRGYFSLETLKTFVN